MKKQSKTSKHNPTERTIIDTIFKMGDSLNEWICSGTDEFVEYGIGEYLAGSDLAELNEFSKLNKKALAQAFLNSKLLKSELAGTAGWFAEEFISMVKERKLILEADKEADDDKKLVDGLRKTLSKDQLAKIKLLNKKGISL